MKFIIIAVLGIAVFAGAVTASWWVKTNKMTPPVAESDVGGDLSLPLGRSASGVQNTPMNTEALGPELSVRPQQLSVEEMVRLGMDLKRREKSLDEEEEKLRQQKIHQQIAFADVQAEQGEVDQLRTQVQSELAKAEDLIGRLMKSRQAVLDERAAAEDKLKAIENVQIEVDGQHSENTKKLAQWVQGMDATKAAELLREMSNDGKMPIAVQILSHLEEREAAKILSSIDDAKLVQDLVTEFRNLKTTKQTSRGPRAPR